MSGRRRGNGLLFALAAGALFLGVVALIAWLVIPKPMTDNPFLSRALYVYPDSTAADAFTAATDEPERSAFETLATTPTAVWLLPEVHPTAEIAAFVKRVAENAAAQNQLPVFVVYGVPSRDCGNFSEGGTDIAEYPKWISAIAEGLGDRPTVLIVEPDALALAPSCGTEDAATGLIHDAVGILDSPTTTIYLDGGHSNWVAADVMAGLLQRAGVADVRGFVTNVSNYNTTADEREYGEKLSELLGGAHYVIDTGRNGNGSNGQWCNPDGRAIGDTPSGVDDGTDLDATLWIKNPGESDGTCNGGPSAGRWWAERALDLVRG